MVLLETAAAYILNILTEHEELKKFPQEFVGESVKWVKSWFLRPEEPKTTAKLADPNKSIEVKKDIIADKLDELQHNPQFMQELTAQVQAYTAHKARLKNVVDNAAIDVQGNVHIGDKDVTSDDNVDEKNVVKGGSIKIVGDFHLGDGV